ncbi:MAG TPA: hypothetical protein VEC16_01615, partial [Alphaproteobacteria bacterium]|nr:hypothetical protein [Alphaproteobacteria bacterium]
MKIEYYKTLKDGKILGQYTRDAEEQLTTIFYNTKDNPFASRHYVDAFLIKQIYDIKGIEKHVMDSLEKEIKYKIGRKL